MSEFLYIVLNISLPIILMILIGFCFQKIFKADVTIFVKFNVYILLPFMLFFKVYTIEFSKDVLIKVVPFILIFLVAMFALSQTISLILRYKRPMKKAMSNVFMLTNTGNYGIPLIELAFPGGAIAMASQLIIIIIQNIVSSTFMVYQVSSGKLSAKKSLKNVIKMPALYAIALAIILRSLSVELPRTITIPFDYITASFVALALITLGIRLAEIKSFKGIKRVSLTGLLRVLLAPVLAFCLVKILGITGVLSQALIIGISTPSAVTSAIIAKEFDNEPDFTAQFVLVTTIFCTFTLPLVIYLVPKML